MNDEESAMQRSKGTVFQAEGSASTKDVSQEHGWSHQQEGLVIS